MKKLIATKGLDKKTWLMYRKRGIGGSDAGQELKLYLGEAEAAENANYRVSWKSVSSQQIDEKRLKEERPEVYEQYRKTLNFRRFTVKGVKRC